MINLILLFFIFVGTANRTVASTQMNATSSRAHTVVTIQFDQISKNDMGQETKKTSIINLVDLAGMMCSIFVQFCFLFRNCGCKISINLYFCPVFDDKYPFGWLP